MRSPLDTSAPRLAIMLALLLKALHSGAAGNPVSETRSLEPLTIEAKIPLGDVQGRIDHLAFDPLRQRLYVAQLGNNTVGILDLQDRRVVRTVNGFDEPQGIAYESSTDTIYVANGGDGRVRVFRAEDFSAIGDIKLKDDADNIRVDRMAHRVYVGYGDGALAVIDPATRTKTADILPLAGCHSRGG